LLNSGAGVARKEKNNNNDDDDDETIERKGVGL
jgi:hypothetical protein